MTEPPDDDEVLPQRSADDSDAGWGDGQPSEPDDDERRYLEDRPPHWQP